MDFKSLHFQSVACPWMRTLVLQTSAIRSGSWLPGARSCRPRDGAKLVESAADIFEELGPQLGPLAAETAAAVGTLVRLDHKASAGGLARVGGSACA